MHTVPSGLSGPLIDLIKLGLHEQAAIIHGDPNMTIERQEFDASRYAFYFDPIINVYWGAPLAGAYRYTFHFDLNGE